MAAHGFTDEQVEHIQNTITLQAGAIRLDVNTITSDAQMAFTAAQKEIVRFMARLPRTRREWTRASGT